MCQLMSWRKAKTMTEAQWRQRRFAELMPADVAKGVVRAEALMQPWRQVGGNILMRPKAK